MSNSKKGAMVLYVLSIGLILYSIFNNEWRIRFSFTKDSDGAQWEQSERYGLRGMHIYHGCKKGCTEEKKSKTSKELWKWDKMISDTKKRLNQRKKMGRNPGTLGLFHSHAKKSSMVTLIMIIIAWLSIVTALGLFIISFIKKIKVPRKIYLLSAGIVGSLHVVLAFYASATLRIFSKAFYAHATYNPTQMEANMSFAFFGTVVGGVFLALSGIIQYLDKGDIMERFALENIVPSETNNANEISIEKSDDSTNKSEKKEENEDENENENEDLPSKKEIDSPNSEDREEN